jgi:hypothetical protein
MIALLVFILLIYGSDVLLTFTAYDLGNTVIKNSRT